MRIYGPFHRNASKCLKKAEQASGCKVTMLITLVLLPKGMRAEQPHSFTHREDAQCHINGLSFTDKPFFDLPITYPQVIVYMFLYIVFCIVHCFMHAHDRTTCSRNLICTMFVLYEFVLSNRECILNVYTDATQCSKNL